MLVPSTHTGSPQRVHQLQVLESCVAAKWCYKDRGQKTVALYCTKNEVNFGATANVDSAVLLFHGVPLSSLDQHVALGNTLKEKFGSALQQTGSQMCTKKYIPSREEPCYK